MGEVRTYDLLRKSVRPTGSGRRALMFLGKPRNARQGKPLHPRFLESVSASLRVSRLDSENGEASNGRPPLLEMRDLSKTVFCEILSQ
jgi:hypothetical protein